MKEILIAVISCNAMTVVITAIITAFQNRKSRLKSVEEKLSEIDEKLKKLEEQNKIREKDELRTQLLFMISDFPHEKQEILTVAERYFGVLNGDWYATPIFNNWLIEQGIGEPEWFNPKE